MIPQPFSVPEKKRVRMIIDTDCKNEADDQFALVHHLLTPMLDVRGVIAAHFESEWKRYGQPHTTMQASYEEICKVLDLLTLSFEPPVLKGADRPLPDAHTPVMSEGASLIIEEAMKDDDRPLFVGLLGTATDLASALLIEPAIASRITAIWIGGGSYPDGGWEFNLQQDVHAANVMFSSGMDVWQVPRSTYKQMNVTLSELRWRVATQGDIGRYLYEQMVQLNHRLGDHPGFPHGESWCLGDQPTVGLLLEDKGREHYTLVPAPHILPDLRYQPNPAGHPIRVYHTLDVRMTMEDFYAKLALHCLENAGM